MNRNTLLQLLIKKKWDTDQFAMFCNILSTTQTESDQLNALLEKSARDVKNRGKHVQVASSTGLHDVKHWSKLLSDVKILRDPFELTPVGYDHI